MKKLRILFIISIISFQFMYATETGGNVVKYYYGSIGYYPFVNLFLGSLNDEEIKTTRHYISVEYENNRVVCIRSLGRQVEGSDNIPLDDPTFILEPKKYGNEIVFEEIKYSYFENGQLKKIEYVEKGEKIFFNQVNSTTSFFTTWDPNKELKGSGAIRYDTNKKDRILEIFVSYSDYVQMVQFLYTQDEVLYTKYNLGRIDSYKIKLKDNIVISYTLLRQEGDKEATYYYP